MGRTLGRVEPVDRFQIGRYPEEEEPPYSVSQELAYRNDPGLLIFESFPERDLFTGIFVGFSFSPSAASVAVIRG